MTMVFRFIESLWKRFAEGLFPAGSRPGPDYEPLSASPPSQQLSYTISLPPFPA